MNSFQSQNLSFLTRFFPRLTLWLGKMDSLFYSLPIAISQGKKGLLTAKVSERFLHSQYDPQSEAQRWAEANPPAQGAVVVFIGWGLGYHVLEWIKRHGKQVTAVVVIEPEAKLFFDSLSCQDLLPLTNAERVEFVLGEAKEELYQTLYSFLELALTNDLQIIPLPFADIYSPESIQSCKSDIQKFMAAKESALSHMAAMGTLCQRHIIQNIPAMVRSCYPRDMQGIADGQPAIIAAAGPSLDKNIDLLPGAQGKAWIFAVDTSLRILQKRGIEPQIVVTKDPTDLNVTHFAGMENLDRPVLAFDPQIHPAIPATFIGPTVCLPHRNHDFSDHIPGLEITAEDQIGLSTNVSIAAFNLAVKMGCSPIIFIGLDLCFSNREGKSHANGSALQSDTLLTANTAQLRYTRGALQDTADSIMVEGIDGELYPTIPTFYESLRYLEARIRETGAKCIDATEGGARIAGTEILPLADSIYRYCNRGINTEILYQRALSHRNQSAIKTSLASIADYLDHCESAAGKALQQIQQGENILRTDPLVMELEKDYKLYQILHVALERLLVEISRHGFWENNYGLRQRLVWYFTQIQNACKTYSPLFREMGLR